MNSKKLKNLSWLLVVILGLGLASCRKEHNDGIIGFTPGKGVPTIASVHTYSKTDTAGGTKQVTAYDPTTGQPVITTGYTAPAVTPFDSTTVTGNKGQMYIIYGTNLGSTTQIAFNGAVAYFNRALITDKSLIVSIPSNAPTTGTAATNKLTITTLYGSVSYNFTVLPPPPTVVTVSDYNFSAGSTLTLSGQGFGAVSSVSLVTGGAAATIVSKNDSVLVLTMPKTTATRSLLSFAYTSAATGTTVLHKNSTQEFVDTDNNYVFFTNGTLSSDWYNNSWAYPSGPTAGTPSISSGKGSYQLNFPAGGWQVEGFGSSTGVSYDAAYKYISFWIKGGTVDHTLVLVGDAIKGGDGQVQNANAYGSQLIKAPKGVWTYYKIPLTHDASTATALNLWETNTTTKSIKFFLQGQSGDVNELFYVDEMMLVK